jgi:hypothetical protein
MKSRTAYSVVAVAVLLTGFFVVTRADDKQPEAAPEPYNIQVPDRRWRNQLPSKPGRICGMLKMSEAMRITGLPSTSLFESNNGADFPDKTLNVPGGPSLECSVITAKDSGVTGFMLGIRVNEFIRINELMPPFDEMKGGGETLAEVDDYPEIIRGKDYFGKTSSTNGGYILQKCPGGGELVIVLGTSESSPTGVPNTWREPLERILTEAKQLGACIAADRQVPK